MKHFDPDTLRAKAEVHLTLERLADIPVHSAEELLHELQVQQIELEMQNEELQRAQAELEETRDRYLDLFEFAPDGYLTLTDKGLIEEVNLTGAALLRVERKNLLNRRFASLVTPENTDNWYRHFLSVSSSDGYHSFELELKRGDGSRFHARLDCLSKAINNISSVRVAITDITDRLVTEQNQKKLTRALKLLSSCGTLLMHANNEQDLLDKICQLAVETGGYLMAWVGFANNDAEKTVRPVSRSGYEEGYLDNIKVTWSDTEHGQGPTGTAIRTRAASVNLDSQTNPNMAPWRKAAFKRGYQSSIGLPLVIDNRALGAVTIYAADPQAFTEEEVALLTELANNLSYGIATLRTRMAQERAELESLELSKYLLTVREEEKARIAREIHDDLGSNLAVLKMDASWMARKLASEGNMLPLQDCSKSMIGHIDNAVKSLRRIIADLRPTRLDDLGLLAALGWLAEQFQKNSGIECRFSCPSSKNADSNSQFDNALSIALYRVFQEVLANVARHSGATRVDAEFSTGNNEVFLSVRDNGRGLPEGYIIAPTSYGMRGMCERVAQLGGKIVFDSPEGGGLMVTVKMPLHCDPLKEALAQSETRYSALFENMLDGYAYCKIQYDEHNRPVDFIFITVNEAFSLMTGLKDVNGKSVREVIPGIREQNPELFELGVRVSSTGIPEVHDFNIRPLGKWFKISMFRPETGHLIAVFFDITQLKQAEEELRIAAIAFETHEGMMVTDSQANIIRVNQAFTSITGYSKEEVLGQNLRFMNSGRQDKAFFVEMWQQLLLTGSWAGEIWDKRKNGEVYPKWQTITAVKNDHHETTHYVFIFSDITERKQSEDEIQKLAFHDLLTGLPNQRLLIDRLDQVMLASKRSSCYGALLFLDLDNFKPLNDAYGHAFGDLLLIEVAGRMKSYVREVDTVARFGSNEFVVILSELDTEKSESVAQAKIVAEKIIAALAAPYRLTLKQDGKPDQFVEHHCTASIGGVVFINRDASQCDVIKWAYKAMYQAKQAGRNAICLYDPDV